MLTVNKSNIISLYILTTAFNSTHRRAVILCWQELTFLPFLCIYGTAVQTCWLHVWQNSPKKNWDIMLTLDLDVFPKSLLPKASNTSTEDSIRNGQWIRVHFPFKLWYREVVFNLALFFNINSWPVFEQIRVIYS